MAGAICRPAGPGLTHAEPGQASARQGNRVTFALIANAAAAAAATKGATFL